MPLRFARLWTLRSRRHFASNGVDSGLASRCTPPNFRDTCFRWMRFTGCIPACFRRMTFAGAACITAITLFAEGSSGNAKAITCFAECEDNQRRRSVKPPSKVLVTGGAGNAGRYIVQELVQHGYKVGVLDISKPSHKDVTHHAVSVLSLQAVQEAMVGYDAVVHLAGIPHPLNDPAKQVFDLNVNGTFNVLEAAAQNNVGKVVFSSSVSVLGFAFSSHHLAPLYIPIDEEHPMRPQDVYGLSKVNSEQICKVYSDQFGICTVCLRMPWVWLPEEAELPFYRSLISGYQEWHKELWAFVDSRDVAIAHRLALEVDLKNDHEAFYITGHSNWTGLDGKALMHTFYPEVSNFSLGFRGTDSLISYGKARRLLGYHPKYSMEDTMGRDIHASI